MRKMGKRLLFAVFVVAVLVKLFFWLSPDNEINGFYCVPKDAIYIIASDQPLSGWNKLSENPEWRFLQGHPLFREIAEDARYLDTLINDQKVFLDLVGERQFITSAHMISPNDYDFLFLFDLKDISKVGGLHHLLEKTMPEYGYSVTKRDFKGNVITELRDAQESTLYLTTIQNYLSCSYTSSIVERSIIEAGKPILAHDPSFLKVFENVELNGFGQLYFQYKYLEPYLGVYMHDLPSDLNAIAENIGFTAADMDLGDDGLGLSGYTSFNPATSLLMHTLHKEGKSKVEADVILSDRTAWFVRYGFSSGDALFDAAMNIVSTTDSAQREELLNQKQRIERLLKIDVARDLFSWIDNEVVLAQNIGQRRVEDEEYAFYLRAKDISIARERLDFVAEQVRKRSPAKFKELFYRNHVIRFLDIKDGYHFLFGKMFDRIKQPYYTIVDDYVIFGNSPATLINLIEDYEQGKTLSESESFQTHFMENEATSTLAAYIYSPNYLPLFLRSASNKTKKGIKEDQKYMLSVQSVSVRMDQYEDGIFASDIAIHFDTTYLKKVNSGTAHDRSLAEENYLRSSKDLQVMTKDRFIEYFDDSKTIKIKASVRDHLLHGDYYEYYRNGKTKIEGQYKRGKRTGTWKYYDSNGTEIKRSRF